MIEAEQQIRAALATGHTAGGLVFGATPDNIAALLAELDRLRQWEVTGREWIDKTDWMQNGPTPARWLGKHRADALRDEITLLRAAIDRQPAPPSAESIEWAGKVFLAEAEKENDALRAEVLGLHRALQHESDCVEAARAEVESLRAECDSRLSGGLALALRADVRRLSDENEVLRAENVQLQIKLGRPVARSEDSR